MKDRGGNNVSSTNQIRPPKKIVIEKTYETTSNAPSTRNQEETFCKGQGTTSPKPNDSFHRQRPGERRSLSIERDKSNRPSAACFPHPAAYLWRSVVGESTYPAHTQKHGMYVLSGDARIWIKPVEWKSQLKHIVIASFHLRDSGSGVGTKFLFTPIRLVCLLAWIIIIPTTLFVCICLLPRRKRVPRWWSRVVVVWSPNERCTQIRFGFCVH
jgi:hypothetical protein